MKNFWRDILGLEFEGIETVHEQKVNSGFFPVGESEVELLESTSPDGPIAKYLEKRGEGIQHIAFRVPNLEEALQELKEKGVRLIDEKPRHGAGGAKIAFLHPRLPEYSSMTFTGQISIQSLQAVQRSSSTYRGCFVIVTSKLPTYPSIFVTSA